MAHDPTGIPLKCPILGFVARSGTGKTQLIESLLPIFQRHALRVGVIKHSHHNYTIDIPGKDSDRLRTAGAAEVALVSAHRWTWIKENPIPLEPRLDEVLLLFAHSALDMILVEGFHNTPFPKIEIFRQDYSKTPLYLQDSCIIAVACDHLLQLTPPAHLAILPLNEPESIFKFIHSRIIVPQD